MLSIMWPYLAEKNDSEENLRVPYGAGEEIQDWGAVYEVLCL